MSDSRRSSSSNHGTTTPGPKNKWIKAFRSLRLTTVGGGSSSRNEASERQISNANRFLGVHAFQEYTYKKITACDVCREILRGHSRQGLKCKLCKMNVHSGACQENAPKCQPKTKLLRKQKSASELEMKMIVPRNDDERLHNYDPAGYRSLKATANARRNAQYGSDNYIEAIPDDDKDNDSDREAKPSLASTSKLKKSVASSNESGNGSSTNVNTIVSSSHDHNMSGNYHETDQLRQTMPAPPPPQPQALSHVNHSNGVPLMSASHRVECEEYRHYPPAPPPPPSVYHYNAMPHYANTMGPSTCASNHESLHSYAKQANPAFLSIAQASQQAYSAPHSPQRKRLTLRMKSLSLDSPESQETLRDKRTMGHGVHACASSSNTPPYEAMADLVAVPYKAPQVLHSPGMPKRFKLQSARMCSFEDNTFDIPSSMSPCPSPKPQRLLPPNIFVVLYNFRSRQSDELNLRAGYMVTVIDTTDAEWWQGKCLGKVGYFPSKYVTKLFPGERPLQVIHTVQVNDGEFVIKLLRDQIVIQVSEEINGMIMVRSIQQGTNDKIVACPAKYLQDIKI